MKKFFMFFIVVLLIFSFAFATVTEEAGDTLRKMGIMNGYPDGTLKLENNITRAEFCTLIIRMLGKEGGGISSHFSDVTESHWAYGTVNKAAELNYLSGYDDGTFKPSNNITYAESCAILVKVLGYGDELEGDWPDNVLNKAEELELNINLEELESGYKMTRGEISVMLINSMNIKMKGDVDEQVGI